MKHPVAKSILGLASLGVIGYCAVGYFYVPTLIESTLSNAVKDNLHNGYFKAGNISFNPLGFSVSLDDLIVKGKKDGLDITAAVKSISAKVNVFSLLSQIAEIDHITVKSPLVVVKTNLSTKSEQSINKIQPAIKNQQSEAASAAPSFGWIVNDISLTNGDFAVADTGIKNTPQMRVHALDLTVKKIGTESQISPYSLKAKLMDGTVSVNGNLNINAPSASFNYALNQLELKHFSPWLYAKSQNNLTSGTFNLKGSGAFDKGISTTATAQIDKLEAQRGGVIIGSLSNLSLLDVTFNSDKQPQLRIGELKTQFANEKKVEKVKKVIGLLGAVAKLAGKDKLASQIETVQQAEVNNVSIKKIVYTNGQLSVNEISKDTVQREIQNQVLKSINKIISK